MADPTKNIQKLKIVAFVSRRLRKSIGYFHILSVINILVEELIVELKIKREIKIPNFGTFRLKPLKPKRIKSVVSEKTILTKPSNSLRFKLSRNVIRYLKGIE
jgi:nucleoid DNA-binding protein